MTIIDYSQLEISVTTGKNIIKRPSTESNVVTPWSHIFEDYYKSEPMDHCHCGRPDYLLLPKGTYKGMKFAIATVINDWDEEKVSSLTMDILLTVK